MSYPEWMILNLKSFLGIQSFLKMLAISFRMLPIICNTKIKSEKFHLVPNGKYFGSCYRFCSPILPATNPFADVFS